MPSMQDIADRVGVNRITVSNVLNGRLDYTRSDAAKRAEEIRRVAREMGFRPSAAARAVKSGRTGFIGMIRSPRLARSVHNPLFDCGIDEALHDRGLCLVRDIIDDAVSPGDVKVPRIVREEAVDGLLVNYAFGTPPAIAEVLDRCRIPTIWVNRKREHNCVHPNDYGAAVEATRHLLLHGHRRIALVRQGSASEPSPGRGWPEHYSSEDRVAGFEDTIRDAGLTPRIDTLEPIDRQDINKVGHEFRQLASYLARKDRPTAILLANALGRVALHAAASVGLKVPQDLSVISFDDDAGADERVGVDRVLVPARPMGRAAVAEVCELIEQPGVKRPPVALPFEFHITGTVGRPRKSARRTSAAS